MEKKLTRKLSMMLVMLLMMLIFAACSSNEEAANTGDAEKETNQSTGSEAEGKEEPKKNDNSSLSIAANPVGSAFNSLGNGLASVISQNSDIKASSKPFAGASAFAPLVNRGEVGMGVANGPEWIWGFRGEQDFKEPLKDLRYIVRGNYIKVSGVAVLKDSDINSVADLKGKRVASDYPGSTIGKQVVEAMLVNNGLSWDDVKKVPTPTITAGVEGLQDKRLDATFALVPTAPIMAEAHNAVGLKAIDILDDYGPDKLSEIPEDIVNTFKEYVPAARMSTVKPNGYVAEEVTAIEYPSMVVGSTHLSDEQVYEVLETLWANYEDLHPIHAWFKQWTPENMFDPNPDIPYHDGAIQFFKDKGLWNDELEKKQQELLEATK